MKVKAIYENGVLKPVRKLDLREKEEIEIEIVPNRVNKTRGIIKVNSDLATEIAASDELSALGV